MLTRIVMDMDMTRGNPYGHLIKFSIPVLIGSVFQQLYSTVDALVVGRFVGMNALAAIGATGSITFFTIGFGMGLTQGFSILISQRYGAKDLDGLRKHFASAILATAVLSVLLSIITIVSAGPLLRVMKTPADIYGDALIYLYTMYAGLPALMAYNLLSSTLGAIGDSRSPLMFLLVCSVLNILIDLLLVTVFGLGCAGAGIASVISQLLSAVMTFCHMMRRCPFLRLRRDSWNTEGYILKGLLRLGLPGALQNSVCALGCVAVQGAVNSFGTVYVASHSISIRIENFLRMLFPAIGSATGTYAGQNLGAGDYGRLKKGFRATSVLGAAATVMMIASGWFLAEPLALLFMDESARDPVITDTTVEFVRTVIWGFIPLCLIIIFRTGCQGLGSASIPLLSSLGELAARVFSAAVLPSLIGYRGIILSEIISWMTGGIVSAVGFLILMKRIRRRLEGDVSNGSC